MSAPLPGGRAPAGLLRASLTLLAGSAAAQAIPLLLGPLLTRLYTPAEFGRFQLFASVAANLAVLGCGRFEFALPLARDDAEAQALRRLALRILVVLTLLCVPAGLLWAWYAGEPWWLALPLAVASASLASLATMWATREQRFGDMAAARLSQHTGTTLGQIGLGWLHWGVAGLIAGGISAVLGGVALLRLPLRGLRHATPDERELERTAARRHREFPLLNTPHAFAGALQDTLAVALIAASLGPAAAGFWSLALRYLKAPATLVGGAVSQALYPKLAAISGVTRESRAMVRKVMAVLMAIALLLAAALMLLGPWAFAWFFGEAWREAGQLAGALALYIGVHFVAAPLAVVTMAWQAQGWALRLALVGQVVFVGALALGLHFGGLQGAGWAVSLGMLGYFGYYFWSLARWPLSTTRSAAATTATASEPSPP
jgi:O-antigen/teichoic acid export membrane protein